MHLDSFDTAVGNAVSNNNIPVVRGKVSVPLKGFEAGIFDNDKDVWWGRFVDLDDDNGTYTLIKTDAKGNYDPNMLITKIVLLALDIAPIRTVGFDVAASAVPLPAVGWMMLTGLVIFGKRLRSTTAG
ncbi:MAG: hypothetical protein V3V31_07195 [Methylococcales bacterium]